MFNYGHWVSRSEKPDNALAFTYFMIFSDRTGSITYYIGYKNINSVRRPWETYTGSSLHVDPTLCIHREITLWFSQEKEAHKSETSQLKFFKAKSSKMFENRSNNTPQCTPEYTKELWEDPDYVAKQSKAHIESMSRPEVKENRKKEAQRRAQDPDFQQHLQNNLIIIRNDPLIQEKRKRSLQKSLTDGKRNYESPEEAANILGLRVDLIQRRCRDNTYGFKYLSGKINETKVRRSVIYNNIEYQTVADAATKLNMKRSTVRDYCRKLKNGFKYK